jgi:hypothetical protein
MLGDLARDIEQASLSFVLESEALTIDAHQGNANGHY